MHHARRPRRPASLLCLPALLTLQCSAPSPFPPPPYLCSAGPGMTRPWTPCSRRTGACTPTLSCWTSSGWSCGASTTGGVPGGWVVFWGGGLPRQVGCQEGGQGRSLLLLVELQPPLGWPGTHAWAARVAPPAYVPMPPPPGCGLLAAGILPPRVLTWQSPMPTWTRWWRWPWSCRRGRTSGVGQLPGSCHHPLHVRPPARLPAVPPARPPVRLTRCDPSGLLSHGASCCWPDCWHEGPRQLPAPRPPPLLTAPPPPLCSLGPAGRCGARPSCSSTQDTCMAPPPVSAGPGREVGTRAGWPMATLDLPGMGRQLPGQARPAGGSDEACHNPPPPPRAPQAATPPCLPMPPPK